MRNSSNAWASVRAWVWALTLPSGVNVSNMKGGESVARGGQRAHGHPLAQRHSPKDRHRPKDSPTCTMIERGKDGGVSAAAWGALALAWALA